MNDGLPQPLDGYHCARCGLDALTVPSLDFLDWEVSCVDDRVIVCPGCTTSGQPARDAIDAALILCADVPRTAEDRVIEVDREAGVAAIATWRDKLPDSCR
jgi:hypothetical protein